MLPEFVSVLLRPQRLSIEFQEASSLLLTKLSERQGQVFVLAVLLDLEQKDVAAILGMTEAAVSKHLRNIRDRAANGAISRGGHK